jgi:putative SOS response-associated peptidase YedK
MCGRYTVTRPAAIEDELGLDLALELAPRYNVAPTQPVPVISNDAPRTIQLYRWGLIPPDAESASAGARLINARSETLAARRAFQGPLRNRRCLILADGFYEWREKRPVYIRLASHKMFAFAGLWDKWRSPEGVEITSCTIITTPPNSLIEPIHDRMPAILAREGYRPWLERRPLSPEELKTLLRPFPPDLLEFYPVSTLVNSAANDQPECILPV